MALHIKLGTTSTKIGDQLMAAIVEQLYLEL